MAGYRKKLYDLMVRIHPNEMALIEYNDFCRDNFFCPGGDTRRLRHYGLKFFSQFFDTYDVSWESEKVVDQISAKHLSWLVNHCKSLYYVGSKKIVLFDADEAFLFQLLDANIDDVANSGGM